MRYATAALFLIILAACIDAEPPVGAGDDDDAAPVSVDLGCVSLTPDAGEADGPVVLRIDNDCDGPISCEVFGLTGGPAEAATLPPGEGWDVGEMCGAVHGECRSAEASVGWGWSISCSG